MPDHDDKPDTKYEAPSITFDEDEDAYILSLGAVKLPSTIDLNNVERVLMVLDELTEQMVEEDILPELIL